MDSWINLTSVACWVAGWTFSRRRRQATPAAPHIPTLPGLVFAAVLAVNTLITIILGAIWMEKERGVRMQSYWMLVASATLIFIPSVILWAYRILHDEHDIVAIKKWAASEYGIHPDLTQEIYNLRCGNFPFAEIDNIIHHSAGTDEETDKMVHDFLMTQRDPAKLYKHTPAAVAAAAATAV